MSNEIQGKEIRAFAAGIVHELSKILLVLTAIAFTGGIYMAVDAYKTGKLAALSVAGFLFVVTVVTGWRAYKGITVLLEVTKFRE